VPYTAPAWARAASDQGVAGANTVIHFELGLDLQDQAAAEQLATAVSTPGSPDYGHFLSPADWIARFAPTQSVFDAAVAQLEAAQLTVTGSPASREYILGTATVAYLDTYFGTRIHRYTVDGRTRYAARSNPTAPASLGVHLASVDFDAPLHRSAAVPAAKIAKGACSAYYGQHRMTIPKAYGRTSASTLLCGYTPKQVRAIYGLDPVGARHYLGHLQTIAVVGAYGAPSMRRDLATFSERNGLSPADYREMVAQDPTHQDECGAPGWQVEQALDLEAAHSVAPHAALLYVGASDCFFGMDLAVSSVLDAGLASIVSNSYGAIGEDPNADRVMLHQHLQAAGEGIGLYFASGDFGDEADFMGAAGVDFPASSPWITAVGGTASALDRHRKLVFTSGWGDNVDPIIGKHPHYAMPLPGFFAGGAGGGVSALFAAPAYQGGVVPASLSGHMRTVSDVAALASAATGFSVGMRPTGSSRYITASIGGTSLATPIVAAEVALAQQQGHRRFGFLNPALYGLVRADPSAVRDVVPSAARRIVAGQLEGFRLLVTVDRDSSLKVRKGYDEVTGVGELTRGTLGRLAGL
jgi:subtilase family serine protease